MTTDSLGGVYNPKQSAAIKLLLPPPNHLSHLNHLIGHRMSVSCPQPRYFDRTAHDSLRGNTSTRCDKGFKLMRPRKKEVSCSDRRRILLESGFNIYANEYTALEGKTDPALAHSCRNMLTVLQVRCDAM
jgi:hypothetical protein